MIRPRKKIGIVYSSGSEKYKDKLKEIITEYKNRGYCIEGEAVDNNTPDLERTMEDRVFKQLNTFDYGIVFITKDLLIKKDETERFVSKPNVLLELGYLRGRLEKNNTCCIADFPHKEIENQIYIMPSDVVGEAIDEIDEKNYEADLEKFFNKFIEVNKNVIVKLENYNANYLIDSLILNPDYKTNYEELFTKNQFDSIDKFSLSWQMKEIFELWLKEKSKLAEEEQIIYLFERMVFLPFFTEEIINKKLNEFLLVTSKKSNEYLAACLNILKNICEYENYKRSKPLYESPSYYLNRADEIEQGLQVFGEREIAPIIVCTAKNYIGLSYLNSYISLVKAGRKDHEVTDKLMKAKEYFEAVIEISRKNFNSSVEIFQAFAMYNLARVKSNLQEDADSEYIIAIQKRKTLSEILKFPETFRLNFTLERIHAEIVYHDYIKEKGGISSEELKTVMEGLRRELDIIKQTPASEVSLFKTLEDKLKKRV